MVLGDVHMLLISTRKGIAADRRTVDRAIRAPKLAQGQRLSVIRLESRASTICYLLLPCCLRVK
jgi:hypothetical protein